VLSDLATLLVPAQLIHETRLRAEDPALKA